MEKKEMNEKYAAIWARLCRFYGVGAVIVEGKGRGEGRMWGYYERMVERKGVWSADIGCTKNVGADIRVGMRAWSMVKKEDRKEVLRLIEAGKKGKGGGGGGPIEIEM